MFISSSLSLFLVSRGSQEALWLIVKRHTAQPGAGEVKGGFLPFFSGAGFPWAVMPVCLGFVSTLVGYEESRSPAAAGDWDFHGLRASRGVPSHEPLQWTLQGVLRAQIQAGLWLPVPGGGALGVLLQGSAHSGTTWAFLLSLGHVHAGSRVLVCSQQWMEALGA